MLEGEIVSQSKRSKRSFALAATVLVAVGLGGTAVATAATTGQTHHGVPSGQSNHPSSNSRTIYASKVAKVVPLDPPSPVFGHITLLEGDAFGPNGELYFVDLTAAPGTSKVFRLNLKTKKTTAVYSDQTSGFSSLQFSPADGKIYLTDFSNGDIDRLNPDGTGFTKVFSGPVEGRTMVPDDIAFDKAGNMYITDYQGDNWNPIGRIVRLDATGKNPIVLQGGLVAPNGISFSPDFSTLWVGELTIGQEDHFTLAADGKSFVAKGVGMRANVGLNGFDSNTVDAAGNVYQCVPGAGTILIWNPNGDLLKTVVVKQSDFPLPGQTTVTNLAIKKGTTDAYVTVGGPNGGYIYHFKALAKGIAQSNGGGA
ncbi:MAG: hypothetical protein JWN95_3362 [Frankiales bacterium]|nr:hypothetical protein [Frankiales bacterium]